MNFDILEKIDHAILKPNLRIEDLEQAVNLACDYPIAALCVHPVWVEWLNHHESRDVFGETQIGSVVGFPFGANGKKVKALETNLALCRGATEIDVVINIGALVNNRYDDIKKELSGIKSAFDLAYNPSKQCMKVILEMCYKLLRSRKPHKSC
jgi:deoxyribose-phosphate aldolase